MTKKTSKFCFGIACLLCVGLISPFGCGRTVNRAAERRVRDALPGVLGPARAYRVHIDNDPDRTIRGRLARVLIDGDQVQLASGLYFDALHLELRGVDVDTHSGRVVRLKPPILRPLPAPQRSMSIL